MKERTKGSIGEPQLPDIYSALMRAAVLIALKLGDDDPDVEALGMALDRLQGVVAKITRSAAAND